MGENSCEECKRPRRPGGRQSCSFLSGCTTTKGQNCWVVLSTALDEVSLGGMGASSRRSLQGNGLQESPRENIASSQTSGSLGGRCRKKITEAKGGQTCSVSLGAPTCAPTEEDRAKGGTILGDGTQCHKGPKLFLENPASSNTNTLTAQACKEKYSQKQRLVSSSLIMMIYTSLWRCWAGRKQPYHSQCLP